MDGVPIMAHPPATSSDLTLELFLQTVIQVPGVKGKSKFTEYCGAHFDILIHIL